MGEGMSRAAMERGAAVLLEAAEDDSESLRKTAGREKKYVVTHYGI